MKSNYEKKIEEVKNKPGLRLSLGRFDGQKIVMRPVTKADVENRKLIASLANWRREYSYWFPGQFKVTLKGTETWLDKLVVKNPDRILFVIEDEKGRVHGHLGFYRYDSKEKSCELDNVVRGTNDFPGMMTAACKKLTLWGFDNLGIKKLYLTVFADNQRATTLYKRCGFVELEKIPLKKVTREGGIYWEEAGKNDKIQRYNLRMQYARS